VKDRFVNSGGEMSRKRTVEFDAHKKLKMPTEVEFKTRDGGKVDFMAKKPQTFRFT
jgi:hypothetical protein